MTRKEYLLKSLKYSLCTGTLLSAGCGLAAAPASDLQPDELERLKMEKEFVQNWLSDLLDSMDRELDEATVVRLIEGCGRACFQRFQFKRDLAEKGRGDIDKLIEAYKANFEIWREGDDVHIRFGEVSERCYCPAAYYRPARPGDKHCECTRSTHQAIFETALGRPFRSEIVESLRRGGKTCHFIARLG
jgi:hypothetical protein